ncbi:MAG: biosynthetic peptidoglycan transglycosylase [Gemmatimonadales bacterium]
MRRALLGVGALAAAFVFWLFAVWPPPSWYRTHWPARTAFMAMRSGDPATRRSEAPGILYHPVPLDSIAPAMEQAVIIGEDNLFLSHGGIDYLSLARALGYRRAELDFSSERDRRELLTVLPKAWERRDKLRGASTISQQLAKNLYLSASRNPLRKVKEAVITWRLEAALGKSRIMELYLNVVELGDGVWGVEAASQKYFHRSARTLTRDQAAALAGSLPFPLRSNPGLRPGRMRWRQNLILRRMRGEVLEVPRAEEETEEADSTLPPPPSPEAIDSAAMIDSTVQEIDPAPVDSLLPDSAP